MVNKEDFFKHARYLKSAVEFEQMPEDKGVEVAFIGRSNAGKSSALNIVTGIKGLARISKTPGRTQMINFFAVGDQKRLVDLPGYGYAKVPLSIRERWLANVDDYLQMRKCLRGLVVVMDIRHPLKDLDQQVISWAANCSVPTHILLTKADKLNNNAQKKAMRAVTDDLQQLNDNVSLQLFSSLDRTGVLELDEVLFSWLNSTPSS